MSNEPIMDQPDLITAEEIARMCRTEVRTVTESWAYRPDFPRPFKPGKVRLWERREILRWLERRRKSA